ncbi:MAG: metallophosphoesterase [Gordonia sp. (in: high G+C Gram-positive bacteria)]
MVRLLVVGLVVALLTYWMHRRLVRATGLTGGWAKIADAVLIVGGVLLVVAFQVGGLLDPSWARPIGFLGFTWGAVLFYLVLGVIVTGLASLVARALGAGPESCRRGTAVASVLVVAASVGTVGIGLVEASSPQVTRDEVAIDGLPESFDGVRVVFLSDLHVGPARGVDYTRRVVDLVNGARPDLIVLGGDLTDGTVEHVGDDLLPLADLRAPLGVYGISGNHEYYADDGGSWLDFWQQHLGITPLRNERVAIQRGGVSIDLAGVYDATAPAPYEPNVDAALAGRDENRTLILAAHQPKQADDAQGRGVDLQLSGHTHDGQLWPFRYAVMLAQPVTVGRGQVGDVPVLVSRGVGAWGPPVRVGAPPEINVVTLRRTA